MGLAIIAERIRGLAGWRRAAVTLFAGGAAAMAMPPFDLWPVLFLAMPVFAWLVQSCRRWRSAFLSGWLFGAGYFTVCFYWVGIAFLVDAAHYLWMMPFMVGALAGGMAIYWGLAALAAPRLTRRGISFVLILAVSLAGVEWLRGHLFTGFPWTPPGLAAIGMGGVAQAAALIGMPGLTLLICLWTLLPALLGERLARRRDIIAAAAILALLPVAWIWGSIRMSEPDHFVDGVKLRIVQPNIAQDAKWRADNSADIFHKLATLSQTKSKDAPNGIAGVTHLIWPESAVPVYLAEREDARAWIDDLLPEGTTLIVGALRRDLGVIDSEGRPQVYNSILVLDGGAKILAQYDKWRLVPGGEFLPFESVLAPLGFRKVVTVPGSFAAGAGPVTLPVPGAPSAGMLICYEAIFPDRLVDATARPGWFINVTNDGWFGNSTGPYQHLAQARMRAIEQGLPMARAANTGISAVIDPFGRINARLALGVGGVLDSPLSVALPATLYARWGDWTLGLLVLVFAAVAGLAWSKGGDH